jgi:hypothetical protein
MIKSCVGIWVHKGLYLATCGLIKDFFGYMIIVKGIHLARINNKKRVIKPFTKELKLKFHLNSSENMFCNLLQLKEMS